MASTASGRPFADFQRQVHGRGRLRPRDRRRGLTFPPCTGLLSASCALSYGLPLPNPRDPSAILLTVAILRLWFPQFFYGPRAIFLPASHPFGPPATCQHGRHRLPSPDVSAPASSARSCRRRRRHLSPVSGPASLPARTTPPSQPRTPPKSRPTSLTQVIALCNLSLTAYAYALLFCLVWPHASAFSPLDYFHDYAPHFQRFLCLYTSFPEIFMILHLISRDFHDYTSHFQRFL
jgi:hypothetical protein